MYIPKIYEVTDDEIIEQFIKANSFATLVSANNAGIAAAHIPLELEVNEAGQKLLRGHMSKANPQWKNFSDDQPILAIFLSQAHHYISSSWYEQPNVPTWNYMSVHITGKVKLIEGAALWEMLKRLTDKYEAKSQHPVKLDELPDHVKKEVNGLVGFEISIEKTEAAFKLSQNRNEKDYRQIIQELRNTGDVNAGLMADAMEKQAG